MYGHLVTFTAAFLGSAVESVEALTIVLAVALTRGWRTTLYATVAALVSLAVRVGVFGQLVAARVPEGALKLVIGTLVLLFGLRWLNKAVLRSAGVIDLHDEETKYQETLGELEGGVATRARDWTSFVISCSRASFWKVWRCPSSSPGCGLKQSRPLPIAAAGGLVAMLAVAGAGAAIRRPLSRVPENILKFAVGVILASLGTFWVSEGMGLRWPGDFLSVFALAAIYLGAARLAVMAITRRQPRSGTTGAAPNEARRF